MKKLTETTRLLSFICAFGVVLTATSCKKDNDADVISKVSVINSSANNIGLDFMVDNQKVNSQALVYGDIIDYFNVHSGNRAFSVYNRTTNTKIGSKSSSLSPDKLYSVFVTDTASKTTLIVAEDDLTRPATGKAKIRFIHLSPDAAKLDVASGDSTLFSGKVYKEHTDFRVIEGDKTYSFKIKLNGAADIKAALDNIEIKKNRIYTILVKGFSGKTDDYKFDAEIITNLE